ncbi:hypothetical protein [Dishui lake virophage 1]|nr:hypothetical protein [Dishui lake virophage 1]
MLCSYSKKSFSATLPSRDFSTASFNSSTLRSITDYCSSARFLIISLNASSCVGSAFRFFQNLIHSGRKYHISLFI